MHAIRLCFYTLLVAAPVSATSILPPGRCVLLFHELSELKQENPTSPHIGAVTMRAATVIAQQTGIIILSPAIWYNLLYRRLEAERAAQEEGSPFNLLVTAWNEHLRAPSAEHYQRVHALLKNNQNLFHTLFIWQLSLESESWLFATHPDASLVILIPRSYLAFRRSILTAEKLPFTRDECASGLNLSQCTFHTIPLPSDKQAINDILRKTQHMRKRSTFTPEHFAALFIARNALPTQLVTSWHMYASGHGYYAPHEKSFTKPFDPAGHEICGLSFVAFQKCLAQLNARCDVSFFYYQSCYSGGQHLFQLYHYNTFNRSAVGTHLDLHFPLVAGALSETPVYSTLPSYKYNALAHTLDIVMPVHVAAFFDALETDGQSLAQILRPITPPLPTLHDMHALSATPLMVPPHTTTGIAIDVTSAPAQDPRGYGHTTQSGLAIVSAQTLASCAEQSIPFVVKGKRAVLLSPLSISEPLIIHPYHTLNRATHTTTTIMPALVSLAPGSSIHWFSSLSVHDTPLNSFLIDGFARLKYQHTTKIFLIDSLTLSNDLARHIKAEGRGVVSSLLNAVSEFFSPSTTPLTDPRITLSHVVIFISHNRLECFFSAPCNDHALHSYHIGYKIDHALEHQELEASQLQLSLDPLPDKKHLRIYTQYKEIHQKMVLKVSAEHATHEMLAAMAQKGG